MASVIETGRERGAPPDNTLAIVHDPLFQELVSERRRFAWTLSAITLVVYLGFILLLAFAHNLMATPVFGGPTSLGIVLGIAVIIFAFAITGVYVVRANSRYDELTDQLRKGR